MIRVLLLGGAGQVGRAVSAAAPPDWQLLSPDRAELDIRDAGAVDRWVARVARGAVVNAAAYTAVDRAETEPEAAFSVNATAAGAVAAACARHGAILVHLSTDYVFDGAKGSPYVETDPVRPLNAYGRSKAQGEVLVRTTTPRHVILRTAAVFGAHRRNFVTAMLDAAARSVPVRVVDDQWTCPTAAEDIAAALVRILSVAASKPPQACWGTFHLCGAEPLSWYDFAEAVFREAQRHGLAAPPLVGVSAAEYGAAAGRPKNSALDCGRIARVYGVSAPPWRDRLPACVAGLLRQPSPLRAC